MGFKGNRKRAEELSTRQIISLMSFRKPKEVVFNIGKRATTACICPVCKTPINIEFSNYCSNCGQRLKWRSLYRRQYEEEALYWNILDFYKNRNHLNLDSRKKIRRGLKKMISKFRSLKYGNGIFSDRIY